jgi:hypothetical protein
MLESYWSRETITPNLRQGHSREGVSDWQGQVQQITGESVEVAFVDSGYTGKTADEAATDEGIRARSSQTSPSQEKICTAPASVGSGAQLCKGQLASVD